MKQAYLGSLIVQFGQYGTVPNSNCMRLQKYCRKVSCQIYATSCATPAISSIGRILCICRHV